MPVAPAQRSTKILHFYFVGFSATLSMQAVRHADNNVHDITGATSPHTL